MVGRKAAETGGAEGESLIIEAGRKFATSEGRPAEGGLELVVEVLDAGAASGFGRVLRRVLVGVLRGRLGEITDFVAVVSPVDDVEAVAIPLAIVAALVVGEPLRRMSFGSSSVLRGGFLREIVGCDFPPIADETVVVAGDNSLVWGGEFGEGRLSAEKFCLMRAEPEEKGGVREILKVGVVVAEGLGLAGVEVSKFGGGLRAGFG